MKAKPMFKILTLFLFLGSFAAFGQGKKKVMKEEEAAIAQAVADSTAAYSAAQQAEAEAMADSIAAYESAEVDRIASDPFYGTFNYKNTKSFTGYVLRVSSPKNSFSDYSFELEVSNPENKYSIEGFAVKKEETVEYYFLKTKKGTFPLASTVNKKKPLFSLKKVNDFVLTIWGQIHEEENIKVLFKK